MTACSGVRSSSPWGLFRSVSSMDCVCACVGLCLERPVTAFMEVAGLAFHRLYERIS